MFRTLYLYKQLFGKITKHSKKMLLKTLKTILRLILIIIIPLLFAKGSNYIPLRALGP